MSLERAFREFDENGDGEIDYDELRNGMRNLGADVSDDQLRDVMALLDKDGDGSIDYIEFSRWFGAGPPPPPMLPQVKAMEDARKQAEETSAGPDRNSFLSEIASAASSASQSRAYAQQGIPAPPPGAPPPPAPIITRGATGSITEAIQAAAEKRSRVKLLETKAKLSAIFSATGSELERLFRSFGYD